MPRRSSFPGLLAVSQLAAWLCWAVPGHTQQERAVPTGGIATPVASAASVPASGDAASDSEPSGGVRPVFLYGAMAWLFLVAIGALAANDHHRRGQAGKHAP